MSPIFFNHTDYLGLYRALMNYNKWSVFS